ncbi:MAG: outer membrane adhesin-like protein, partial [bacterium]
SSLVVLGFIVLSCGQEGDTPTTGPDRPTESRDEESGKPEGAGTGCPTATPAQYTFASFSREPIQLAGSDPDGDPLTFAIVQQPVHGALEEGKDGMVTYLRPTQLCGEQDSFTFTVSDGSCTSAEATISIDLNCCPRFVTPLEFETEKNTPISFQVTVIDPDGDPLEYNFNGQPDHGTLVIDAQGHATYTPPADYCGPDEFSLFASDGDCGTLGIFRITVCPIHDEDEDGVPDEDDSCPDSDVRGTIWINGCDTGVPNPPTVDASGCSVADDIHTAIEEALLDSGNHGEFVSSFHHYLKMLVRDGVISRQDQGAIAACATQAGYE